MLHIHMVLEHQVRDLFVEAGGKAIAKKDLSNQLNTFTDIFDYFEEQVDPMLYHTLMTSRSRSNVEPMLDDIKIKVISDHMRAIVYLISNGVKLSSSLRGYVVSSLTIPY